MILYPFIVYLWKKEKLLLILQQLGFTLKSENSLGFLPVTICHFMISLGTQSPPHQHSFISLYNDLLWHAQKLSQKHSWKGCHSATNHITFNHLVVWTKWWTLYNWRQLLQVSLIYIKAGLLLDVPSNLSGIWIPTSKLSHTSKFTLFNKLNTIYIKCVK